MTKHCDIIYNFMLDLNEMIKEKYDFKKLRGKNAFCKRMNFPGSNGFKDKFFTIFSS